MPKTDESTQFFSRLARKQVEPPSSAFSASPRRRRVADVLADALQHQLDKTLAEHDAQVDDAFDEDASEQAASEPPAWCDPIAGRYDVRSINSLELSTLATELYQDDRIGREAYAMLSFQPETRPVYDRVGARGAERPDPQRKRDALTEWRAILQQQIRFEYSDYFLRQTRTIIDVLETLDRSRRGG